MSGCIAEHPNLNWNRIVLSVGMSEERQLTGRCISARGTARRTVSLQEGCTRNRLDRQRQHRRGINFPLLNRRVLRFFLCRRRRRGPQLAERSPLCRVGGYAERTTGAIAIGAAAPKWWSVPVASVLIWGQRSARHSLGALQAIQESQ